MKNIEGTPIATLQQARRIALQAGLKHVYTGNCHDVSSQSTYCSSCDALLIERDWYALGTYDIKENACAKFSFKLCISSG